MIRIFSSKYIVAVLATMAMTSNNSNGGVHAKDLATIGQAYSDAAGNAVNAVGEAYVAAGNYMINKDSNETDIPDDVDVGVPNEGDGEIDTNTGPGDGQAVASESGVENVAAPSGVSSASLLLSSMVGIAAVTTAFVAIA